MNKLFLGGVPTEVDVRKLREAFATIKEGDEIAHEQVEQVLSLARTTNRYRGVTLSWRKSLQRDHGIQLGAVAGVGFRCLNPQERVSDGVKGFQSGARKQLRAVKSVAMVRTDDPQLQAKQALMRRYGAAVANEVNSMMREIEPPKAVEQLPRLVPKRSTSAS